MAKIYRIDVKSYPFLPTIPSREGNTRYLNLSWIRTYRYDIILDGTPVDGATYYMNVNGVTLASYTAFLGDTAADVSFAIWQQLYNIFTIPFNQNPNPIIGMVQWQNGTFASTTFTNVLSLISGQSFSVSFSSTAPSSLTMYKIPFGDGWASGINAINTWLGNQEASVRQFYNAFQNDIFDFEYDNVEYLFGTFNFGGILTPTFIKNLLLFYLDFSLDIIKSLPSRKCFWVSTSGSYLSLNAYQSSATNKFDGVTLDNAFWNGQTVAFTINPATSPNTIYSITVNGVTRSITIANPATSVNTITQLLFSLLNNSIPNYRFSIVNGNIIQVNYPSLTAFTYSCSASITSSVVSMSWLNWSQALNTAINGYGYETNVVLDNPRGLWGTINSDFMYNVGTSGYRIKNWTSAPNPNTRGTVQTLTAIAGTAYKEDITITVNPYLSNNPSTGTYLVTNPVSNALALWTNSYNLASFTYPNKNRIAIGNFDIYNYNQGIANNNL